jgi:hypothetical protein
MIYDNKLNIHKIKCLRFIISLSCPASENIELKKNSEGFSLI